MNTMKYLQNEKGFTLMEIAMVVGIAALFFLGFVFAPSIYATMRANSDIALYPLITANVQNHHYGKATYAGLGNAKVVSFKLVPDNMIAGTSSIVNRYAGAVTFAPATVSVTNDSFTMSSALVPARVCLKVVNALANQYVKVDVDSTTVKAVGGTLSETALASSCNDSTTNTIVFTVGK